MEFQENELEPKLSYISSKSSYGPYARQYSLLYFLFTVKIRTMINPFYMCNAKNYQHDRWYPIPYYGLPKNIPFEWIDDHQDPVGFSLKNKDLMRSLIIRAQLLKFCQQKWKVKLINFIEKKIKRIHSIQHFAHWICQYLDVSKFHVNFQSKNIGQMADNIKHPIIQIKFKGEISKVIDFKNFQNEPIQLSQLKGRIIDLAKTNQYVKVEN